MAEKTVVKHKNPSSEEKERSRIPCLIVVEGNYVGEVFQLDGSSTTIGRSEESTIALSEEGVSRSHARIDSHQGSYSITDLGSTNGTFVNGSPIEQTVLHEGDKIRLGDVLLRFSFQDSIDVKYQEQLRNLAIRDALTKVFNRRYFLDCLAREMNYAMRLRQPLTCILLDLDHFKQVNDTHGHQAGDLVLKEVASTLEKEVRGYDVFARYGGEEFVILLRGTALENALIFAERARKIISEMKIKFDEKAIRITVSMGVASLNPDQPQTQEGLIKEADRYLYQAKAAGRNRVWSSRTEE